MHLPRLSEILTMDNRPDIKYICTKCHIEEFIPQDIIDFFDTIDPERALLTPAAFQCETCGSPMLPENFLNQHKD